VASNLDYRRSFSAWTVPGFTMLTIELKVSRTLAADSAQGLHLGLARLLREPRRSSELLSAVADTLRPAS